MKIINFEELDSTNTYCKQNIRDLEDKTVVSTNVQTNGYGRFTRSWVDLGRDNVFMSFVLKPSDKLEECHANLTQYLAICLAKHFESLGLFPQIKWPNDILINGKKLAGIAAESVISNGKLLGIVLGIGVNLNTTQEKIDLIDRPVTSLNIELGHNVDKPLFINNLVDRFFLDYDEFLKNGFEFIKPDYDKRLFINKNNVKVKVFDELYEGTFIEIDKSGNLVLALNNGQVRKFNMGEIMQF